MGKTSRRLFLKRSLDLSVAASALLEARCLLGHNSGSLVSTSSSDNVVAEPNRTSLTNKGVKFRKSCEPTVQLRHGSTIAVIVDNSAFGATHKEGYNGLASLIHDKRSENLFVPFYAGLNLEHVLDGRNLEPRELLYEPRNFPMELRIVDGHTVELYQAPAPIYKLESCTRFAIDDEGIIHMRFECIPREKLFRYGYIGLFWASYIHQPESSAIHFLGREAHGTGERWIRALSPQHGVDAVHPAANDRRQFEHDSNYALTLVFNRSKYVYTQPFYYGLSHGMACVQMFREKDLIRFTQSPSGGGQGNPAWDFQWYISQYQVDQIYGFEMAMAYVPFESPEQVRKVYEKQRVRWSE